MSASPVGTIGLVFASLHRLRSKEGSENMSTVYEKNADRILGYVRIRKTEKRNPEQIHRSLQKGYRIEHPEKVTGYAGFFFDLGDVYASGPVAAFMEVREFRSFVMESVKRFDKGDYGLISEGDEFENNENRWMFGIDRLFGRYGYHYHNCQRTDQDPFDEIICIRKHNGNTWVTYDSEADWFLFLEEEDLEKIKDKSWKLES